ncbi:unnamed protein product [Chondrus crispus]|uniref:Uncharacterized protein n=1 Tax=Chondrus crispus TaxID=2769 RepID=R7QMU5_CHOCR|nr:unnamed protein product [Chondrus crispus]CDF39078.1 unnamed protein product [Chondrus crispus]|eukprot:XP_005718989.1 unnamed protein product [Chondrus crispus]
MATHGSRVVVLGWLEDGKRLFSADDKFNIVIWRWDNLERVQEEEEEVDKVNKEGQEFTAVAWSSDDICATVVGDVVMYDVKTGKKMWGDAETHVSPVYCLEMSGDSKRVFTAAEDGTFAMWDSKTGDKLWECGEAWAKDGYDACWSNDGTRVFVSFGRGMGLWDGKTGNKSRLAARAGSCC